MTAMPKLSAQARARKIKLLLFDVDGVLTDGKLFLPARSRKEPDKPQSASSAPKARSSSKDSTPTTASPVHWRASEAFAAGLITRRYSETVALRARDLKLEFVRQGNQDKGTALEEIATEAGISARRSCVRR